MCDSEYTVDAEEEIGEAIYEGKTLYEIFKGRKVFVRTVTFHHTGRVLGGGTHENGSDYLILGLAAWVADSGRFNQALETGKLEELEPYPDGPVYVSGIIDCCMWNHPLPRKVK